VNDEIKGNAEPSNNEAEDEHVEEKLTPVESELVSDVEEESSTPESIVIEESGQDLNFELAEEIRLLKEDVLRARADVENVRKRAEKDVTAAHKYGLERLLQELLPVKDSIDMGLEATAAAESIQPLREGMELTVKMFSDFFEKLNVKVVDPVNEKFDPQFQQAMMTEVSASIEEGHVIRVMQKGYLLNDRLVRPALVVVSKAE
jgi:molecular chaperone GrpE